MVGGLPRSCDLVRQAETDKSEVKLKNIVRRQNKFRDY